MLVSQYHCCSCLINNVYNCFIEKMHSSQYKTFKKSKANGPKNIRLNNTVKIRKLFSYLMEICFTIQ